MKKLTNDVLNFKQLCPVLQAMHTPLFRQAAGVCVETVTENSGLSQKSAVVRPVPGTRHSRVVAHGQMLYTEYHMKVMIIWSPVWVYFVPSKMP